MFKVEPDGSKEQYCRDQLIAAAAIYNILLPTQRLKCHRIPKLLDFILRKLALAQVRPIVGHRLLLASWLHFSRFLLHDHRHCFL